MSRRIVGGVLAAVVAAGTAYAVPAATAAGPEGSRSPDDGSSGHLSSRLDDAVVADAADLSPAGTAKKLGLPATGAGSLMRIDDGNKIVVDVRMSSYGPDAIADVEAAGGEVINDDPRYGYLTVAAAASDLTAVSEVPGVEYVGEELVPQTSAVCDGTISQGDAILHANGLRGLGVDGSGMKVGVLSDSYDTATGATTHAAGDIASDNLPGATNGCGHTSVSTITESPTPEPDEGRAMMQIVHDLAPGAALDFATANPSEADFASHITQLGTQGADVIVDDITYFDEPMYQDGIVEQAVTGVRASGVDYFTDAANNRQIKNGHEVGSYEAVAGYRPTACPAIITGHADCHNFGTAAAPDSTFTYTANAGTTIRAILNWAEPWGGVNTDFDIYLVNETTNVVTAGEDVNTGGGGSQKAFEILGLTQGSSAPVRDIVVARKSAAPPAATPRFKIVFAANGPQLFNTMQYETPVVGTDVMGPTAFGHNGGADAMSVGASSAQVATALNSYSSYGPVTILFGPVNGLTPAATLPTPRVLAKPDIVASDCTTNTFFGPSNQFCGTSAAAPHAAAVAALLMQKFPGLSTAAINSAMISTASPIAGVPATFQGGGLVNALAAGNLFVPDTAITKAPKKTVKSKKKKVKVSFQFTSTIAGSTFVCSIDRKAFAPCSSGVSYKLKKGKHTFAVAAVANGATDPTQAAVSFKIKKKKPKHHHH